MLKSLGRIIHFWIFWALLTASLLAASMPFWSPLITLASGPLTMSSTVFVLLPTDLHQSRPGGQLAGGLHGVGVHLDREGEEGAWYLVGSNNNANVWLNFYIQSGYWLKLTITDWATICQQSATLDEWLHYGFQITELCLSVDQCITTHTHWGVIRLVLTSCLIFAMSLNILRFL